MKARLLLDRRVILSPVAFVELVLWHVPTPVPGSAHAYKYRLALVVRGECVLRYDNEAGKGGHVHIGDAERPYHFTGAERLLDDFMTEVRTWLDEHRDPGSGDA